MLSRKQRVPREVFSSRGQTKMVATRHLSVRLKKNTEGFNRFAVVIGTKVDKRSTRRNLLKRRIFGRVKEWQNFSSDIIIHIIPAARDISSTELKKEIDMLYSKITALFLKKEKKFPPEENNKFGAEKIL